MDAMTTDEGELVPPDLTPAAGRILDAAAELFYLHGIHAVGVDTIADASGVTKRTLYDRFGSKDVLVATYLRARHAAWWARLDERLAEAPEPRALAVFDAYAQDAPSVERGCAFLNAAGELPAGHPAHAVIRAHKHAVRVRLEELVRADRPDLDAAATAEHLFLLLEGGVAQRGIDGDARLMRSARELAARLLG
ncbi:TetR/AcrR family transcriptional regulator [Aeromicrobium tamlense]|uniref:AcrR family transcriptional regulator n=2 Tax=Aeromicrobium tamlense TaxID=375541 RepID=A0ABX2SFQ1_9ACTN|nr:TetR/AcrR family transcriptional regulator [Aeromicrobium tamlense]NYI37738.1 AcrR family transcriptional regulator [Aeromicrobium tamlense]